MNTKSLVLTMVLLLTMIMAWPFFPDSAYGFDVPLEYVTYTDSLTEYMPTGTANIMASLTQPSDDLILPDFNSKQPLFAFIELGDTKRLAVYDKKDSTDKFYTCMYFDENGNGDLTDDTEYFGETSNYSDKSLRVAFSNIDTKVTIDSASCPYSFHAAIYCRKTIDVNQELSQNEINKYFRFSIKGNCAYTAKIPMKQKTATIVFSDTNCNARFFEKPIIQNSSSRRPSRLSSILGDNIFIDRPELTGSLIFGEMLYLNGALFEISVDHANAVLSLKEHTAGLLDLELSMEMDRLTLIDEKNDRIINVYESGRKLSLPPGDYSLFSYIGIRNDESGDQWRLSAYATVDSPHMVIDKNHTVLPFGEPFTPVVDIPELTQNIKTKQIKQAHLNLNVIGCGNEVITDIHYIHGPKTIDPVTKRDTSIMRPDEPAYRITRSNGEIVTGGSFEYG